MNEISALILLIITSLTIILSIIFYEKKGIYYVTILLNIITYITSFKIIYVFKMNINLSIFSLIGIFTLFYIYINKSNDKSIKDLIKTTLMSNILIMALLVIINYYIPSIIETNSINIKNTFEYNYKIIISYPIVILVSQYLIYRLYKILISINDNNYICIILTSIITSVFYTIIFTTVSYIKILTLRESLFIGVSNYIIGLAITLINLIIIKYITKKKVIK